MDDDSGQKAAEALASELVFRTLNSWGGVFVFRRMANIGLPHAQIVTAWDHAVWCEEFATSDEYANMFLVDRKELIKLGVFDRMAKALNEQAERTFKASLDAASLIFAHSLLDSAAYDWCRVCSLAMPTDFIQLVGQRKVSIADAQNKSQYDLLRQAIDDHLRTLEREPVLRKLDLLFALCKPPPSFEGVIGYTYDRNRVVLLDELRHRYVHGGYPGELLPNGDADLLFLQQTSMFLLPLVHHRYGIRIDPAAMSTGTR